jgi:bacterioferritin
VILDSAKFLDLQGSGERSHCFTARKTKESKMATQQKERTRDNAADGAAHSDTESMTRERLIELLNEDLQREYQAVIAYVVYSQAIKGAEYMTIAKELEKHAEEELSHALTIAKQIDYLGGEPATVPMPVKRSTDSRAMLQFDLDNETDTIRNYRTRVKQCEALGEFAIAEHLRRILTQEQDHQIELATALGIDVPRT